MYTQVRRKYTGKEGEDGLQIQVRTKKHIGNM